MKRLIAVFVLGLLAAAASAQDRRDTAFGPVTVERMVSGLKIPWSIAFLPGEAMLITERGGRLLYLADGRARPVAGVPEVVAVRQGGLLDVIAARDFAQSREIFLSYSRPGPGGARTALAAARLSERGTEIEDLSVIFEMSAGSSKGIHFGSRIVEAPDGALFLTIGDRGAPAQAQNPQVHNGKIIRVRRDGSVPPGNAFEGGGGRPEIWSIGHRNPQGAALDEAGRLWTVAHGAKGGDEINRPERGRNYGWPVISYGVNYSGSKIGEGTEKPGMEQPRHYWDPSIAPSGMMIYSGRLFPQWKGDIFVGSLKFDLISRLERDGGAVREAERLFEGAYERIRDIREAPDGSIWFLSEGDGAAYRITPG